MKAVLLHPRTILLIIVAMIAGMIFYANSSVTREQIEEAIQNGRSEEALGLLDSYLAQHPKNVELGLLRAQLLFSSEPDVAIDSLHQLVDDSTFGVNARKLLAAGLVQLQRYPEAAEVLTELAAEFPEDVAVILALAETLHALDRNIEALPYSKRAAELDERAETYLLIGEILDDLGRVVESIDPLTTAAQLNPESLAVQSNLAYALTFAGEFEKAIDHLQQALAIDPENIELLTLRAKIQRELGETTDALKTLENVLTLAPNHSPAILLYSELMLFQKRPAEALASLQRIPNEDLSHHALSLLYRAAQLSGERELSLEYQEQLRENLRNTDRAAQPHLGE